MNTDGKPHHVKNEDDPAVGFGLFSLIFPFQDGPENQGCKERGRTVYFPFNCTVPERITEGISQGAYDAGADDGKNLAGTQLEICLLNDFTGEMGDGPEEKENRKAAQDSTHEIHRPGSC